VIIAFPNSVSIIAPLIRMFCLARNTFDGVSRTFFIVAFFVLFFVIMFATLSNKDTNFFVFPLPLMIFVFLSPIFTILACFCLPVSFFFFGFLYLPPEVFLPDFIEFEKIFDLNRFGLGASVEFLP
jgi:hypothetical protein